MTDDSATQQRVGELITDLRREVTALLDQLDRRYGQRFDDQNRAVDAAFAAQKDAVTAALVAAEKAVAKAETATTQRLDNANEFRGQLGDQARTLMPRQEAEARFTSLDDKVAAIATRLEKIESKGAGLKEGWAYLVGGLGAVSAVIMIIIEVMTRVHR